MLENINPYVGISPLYFENNGLNNQFPPKVWWNEKFALSKFLKS